MLLDVSLWAIHRNLICLLLNGVTLGKSLKLCKP